MFGREALEAPAQLVAVDDDAEDVAGTRLGRNGDLAVGHPSRHALGLGIADPKEQLVAPTLELAGVAQAADVPPDVEEGLLHRVLGDVRVTQDTLGHAQHASVLGDVQ